MDFRRATDEISKSLTHNDIADAIGVSVQSVRQARLDPESAAHRKPPADWQRALAQLASTRSQDLQRLAELLQRETGVGAVPETSLLRKLVAPLAVRLPSGRRMSLARSRVTYEPWTGDPIRSRYGGREVVEFGGRPTYPELAVLHALRSEGWDGVWIDALRQKHWVDLPQSSDPVTLPTRPSRLLRSIVRRNGGLAGAWDVFAWKEDRYLFARPLHTDRELLASQLTWIESAAREGLSESSFLLVEWEMAPG